MTVKLTVHICRPNARLGDGLDLLRRVEGLLDLLPRGFRWECDRYVEEDT